MSETYKWFSGNWSCRCIKTARISAGEVKGSGCLNRNKLPIFVLSLYEEQKEKAVCKSVKWDTSQEKADSGHLNSQIGLRRKTKLFPPDMHVFFIVTHLNVRFCTCLEKILKRCVKSTTQQLVVNNGVVTYCQRRDGFARDFHGEDSVFDPSFTPPRSARRSCTSHRRSPLSRPPLCGSGAGFSVAPLQGPPLWLRAGRMECAPHGWKWEVALLRGTRSVHTLTASQEQKPSDCPPRFIMSVLRYGCNYSYYTRQVGCCFFLAYFASFEIWRGVRASVTPADETRHTST